MATNESGEKRLATTVPYTSILDTHQGCEEKLCRIFWEKWKTKGPSYSELLDGFSVLTGQLNTLSKTIANEKGEYIHKCNRILLVIIDKCNHISFVIVFRSYFVRNHS